jgi:hypothetical protein
VVGSLAITIKTNKGKGVAAMVTYTVPGMKSDAAKRATKKR